MIKTENNQIFSDSGKFIHRLGSDTYFRKGMILPSQRIDEFEEVDEIPAYTKVQYDEMVAKLVREKYSESEEFAIQRKAINEAFSPSPLTSDSIAMAEYREYNSFVEECKVKAKDPKLYSQEEL